MRLHPENSQVAAKGILMLYNLCEKGEDGEGRVAILRGWNSLLDVQKEASGTPETQANVKQQGLVGLVEYAAAVATEHFRVGDTETENLEWKNVSSSLVGKIVSAVAC